MEGEGKRMMAVQNYEEKQKEGVGEKKGLFLHSIIPFFFLKGPQGKCKGGGKQGQVQECKLRSVCEVNLFLVYGSSLNKRTFTMHRGRSSKMRADGRWQ